MEQDVDLNNEVVKEAISVLSQGNPGAITVLIQLVQAGAYDIITYMLAFGPIGSDIWVEYKDIRGQDIDAFMAEMRLRIRDAEELAELAKEIALHG